MGAGWSVVWSETNSAGEERETIYQRGHTWGQFDAARGIVDGSASLSVYGRAGFIETVRLTVALGETRVFQ
jgi:hypothetical protein